jgi:gliding motility-associated-like protein
VDFIVEDNSCTANRFDTITVEFDMSDFEVVVTEFLPPNVFTPNGDQANECFEIPEDKLPPDNCKDWFERIEIYNRWGKMVYQSQARNFQWCVEGDFTTGTYYYLVYYRNSKYKGTVSLLR